MSLISKIFPEFQRVAQSSLKRFPHNDLLFYSPHFADYSYPSIDFKETSKNYIVKADLPGFKKDQINISVKGNMLNLSGEKTSEREDNDTYHVRERLDQKFYKSISLPYSVPRDQITATLNDGVLELVLPKQPDEIDEKIPIN
ncbi:Heat shock 70 kDa protein 1A [Boothiomyces sp. JEL0866]|nr:Heat shock 70 kDa protein 1A [Boothiomyces sp. JEL0866]